MNKVVLIGRFTKEPELRYTPSGLSVVAFTLAVDRNFKNANGERETDFISCQAWKQVAELIAKYCHKGNRIACAGRIQVQNWVTDDGQKKYTTQVIIEEISFLENKNSTFTGELQGSATVGEFVPIEDDNVPFLERK